MSNSLDPNCLQKLSAEDMSPPARIELTVNSAKWANSNFWVTYGLLISFVNSLDPKQVGPDIDLNCLTI